MFNFNYLIMFVDKYFEILNNVKAKTFTVLSYEFISFLRKKFNLGNKQTQNIFYCILALTKKLP